MISIIIPTYNEASTIAGTLKHLGAWQGAVEVIVVDGGSSDSTAGQMAEGIKLIQAPKGRASQMNAGAQESSGNILLFLHSDTRLPEDFTQQIEMALKDRQVAGGAFKVRIDHPSLFFYLASQGSNLRASLTGIYFGDQAIFARRDIFFKIGGFRPVAIMEDWDFSLKLKKSGNTLLLTGPVLTSPRRWLAGGKWRTAWLMQKIKLLYLLGVDPAKLKDMYTESR